jgi:PST family polysaccharide transporter
MTESVDYQDVAKRTTHGLGWNYLSFGLSKLLNLLTVSVLAHLLVPEYFGMVALATLAIDYLSVLKDLGLGAAIVRHKGDIAEASNTVFSMNLVMGFGLSLVTYFISPWAADFFHEPMVTPILRWLGLSFIINSIGSVHYVRLQREMKFRQRLIADIGTSVLKAIVSISMALAGFHVWSLVFGQLAGALIAVVLLWLLYPWRPHLSWNARIAKELFAYGSSVMGNNAFSILEDSFDYILIGRFYDSTALGIYTLAYRLPELLVINILWLMTAVLFPAFAALQDEHGALKKSFLAVVRYVELLVTPVCVGLIIAADPIIRVLFGEQWVEAIAILRVLAAYALVVSIGYHVGDVYKAIGRPDILLKTSIPIFIIRVIALWIGAQYGILWVAVAHLAAALVDMAVRLVITSRILKIALLDILRELTAFIGGAALAALAVPTLYLTQGVSPLIRLLCVVAAGGLGYIGFVWLFERNSLLRALKMVTNR